MCVVKFWTVIDLADPSASHVSDDAVHHETYRSAVNHGAGFTRPNVAGWVSELQFAARRDYVSSLPRPVAALSRPA
jgi:hypothetical protein